jgi:hypothetical protein
MVVRTRLGEWARDRVDRLIWTLILLVPLRVVEDLFTRVSHAATGTFSTGINSELPWSDPFIRYLLDMRA